MNSKIVFLAILLFSLRLSAQNIENPSFDSAYIGGIDRIHAWVTSDTWFPLSVDTVEPKTPSTHYIGAGLQYHELFQTVQLEYTAAFHGAYAINLTSVAGKVKNDGSPYKGFIANGDHFYTDSVGYIDYKKGGTPFTGRPSKLRGHYKFNNTSPSLTNFGRAIVLLKKYNTALNKMDTIAYAETSTQLQATNWSAFELPLTYWSAQTPDSLVIVFESSALGLAGTLTVDSLGFYYPLPSAVSASQSDKVKPFVFDNQSEMIYFKREVNFVTAELINQQGKIVRSLPASTTQMNLSDLPKGVYLLQLRSRDKSNQSFKIVK